MQNNVAKSRLIAAAVLALMLQAAHADIVVTGVLSTGSHTVAVDSATFIVGSGTPYTFTTPGWQGDSMVLDTFTFPPIPEPPSAVIMDPVVDGVPTNVVIAAPEPDSWYVIPSTPTEAKVKFMWETGVEERGSGRPGQTRLTVSPSLVTVAAVIRADPAGRGSRTVSIYDAAGNRVRTLVLHSSGNIASATWNGDDDLGQRLPEGIYYCCLSDAADPSVRKLILTR